MHKGFAILAVLIVSISASAGPCASPKQREFDFWTGDWSVSDFASPEKPVARVRVERILGECVLHEKYQDDSGLKGESFSVFDETSGHWYQSWVTNRGQLLILKGNIEGGAMVLDGVDKTTDGKVRQVHATWSPVSGGVRETAARSLDGGKTWTQWFDLLFQPHEPDTEADRQAVLALDAEYQAAVKNNDATTMDRILADDFILVTGAGKTFTKSDLLREAHSGSTHYDQQADSDQTVRIWGDTAVITAKLREAGTSDGKPFDKMLWFSDTYVRTRSGWKYVFGQASLPPPRP